MTPRRARVIETILASGLLAFFLAAPAAAQASAEFQFSLAFNSSLPKGEFHDVLGKKVWGGSFGFGFRPSWSPVLIGMSMSLRDLRFADVPDRPSHVLGGIGVHILKA